MLIYLANSASPVSAMPHQRVHNTVTSEITYCLRYGNTILKVIETICPWNVERCTSSCSHTPQLRSASRLIHPHRPSNDTVSLSFTSCLGYAKFTEDDTLLEAVIVRKSSQARVARIPYTRDSHLTVSDPRHVQHGIDILVQKLFHVHRPGLPTDYVLLPTRGFQPLRGYLEGRRKAVKH